VESAALSPLFKQMIWRIAVTATKNKVTRATGWVNYEERQKARHNQQSGP
jgi:hypothetical protein